MCIFFYEYGLVFACVTNFHRGWLKTKTFIAHRSDSCEVQGQGLGLADLVSVMGTSRSVHKGLIIVSSHGREQRQGELALHPPLL